MHSHWPANIKKGLSPGEALLGVKSELHSWQHSSKDPGRWIQEVKNLSNAAKDWHFSLSCVATGDPPPPSIYGPEWIGRYTFGGEPAHLIRPRSLYLKFGEAYPGPNELKGKTALVVKVGVSEGLLERVYLLNSVPGVEITRADGTEDEYVGNNEGSWMKQRGVSTHFCDAWEHYRNNYLPSASRVKDRVFGNGKWLDTSYIRAFRAGLPPPHWVYYFEQEYRTPPENCPKFLMDAFTSFQFL